MSGELHVWRDGRVHGVLSERRNRLSLSYWTRARPISVSMPVRSRPYGDSIVRPWFSGLLPEGQIRAMIAYDLRINADDDFELLRVLGRDCAGALSIRAPDDGAEPDSLGPALTNDEIVALLRALPTSPMGVEHGFRVSLPGNQHKLVLTRDDSGWHRPDGVPSTHILKPPNSQLGESSVWNEAYCQWLAAEAGLPAATTTVIEFDAIAVLSSERFDRITGDGRVDRVHQEDGCQMLSIDPRHKYQAADEGPSLSAIARALGDNGGEVDGLLRMATFHAIIGNGDWHGKNVSIAFDEADRVSLAPVYDAMSTRFYTTTGAGQTVSRELGMRIAGVSDIDEVRIDSIIDEATSWGMSTRRSARIVQATIETIRASVDVVQSPIDELRALVLDRIELVSR